jgi:hypothetical protein
MLPRNKLYHYSETLFLGITDRVEFVQREGSAPVTTMTLGHFQERTNPATADTITVGDGV